MSNSLNERLFPRRSCLLLTFLLGIVDVPGAYAARDDGLAVRAKEIMEQRCIVCHGCYDAPCQLKLEAHDGLERGASKALVYDGARIRAAETTRLFEDAFTVPEWRSKGFYPVLDANNPQEGLLYRLLQLKQAHPLPPSGPMPGGFDFSLSRSQQCPQQEEFDQYARDYPLWGMPYGLPGLNADEHRDMLAWLERGAPAVPLQPLTNTLVQEVDQWERLLNGTGNKERLMARYLYEHLFLANLYLEENSQPVWFRLVRSTTPPGREIGLIATRRPFDDPGMKEFYYRLQRMPVTPLGKIHMPYRFDSARRARYRELFIAPDYAVGDLPGYEPDLAANPFKSFQAIPVKSRYRFLLDEARFTVMNFIKGPVCRGQVALNVIEDHFWVMFADPEDIDAEHDEAFLAREADNLRIPTVKTGTPVDLVAWRKYAKAERKYQHARAKFMRQRLAREHRNLGLDAVWDGDGENPNAALTIFRHFDSASVVMGFVGAIPKTAWVIGYPLLERIHYLLVANFDVFGPVSHQLESRLYMDFLRIEGESNFLTFMPAKTSRELQAYWYRDAPSSVNKYMLDSSALSARELGIVYHTDDPKAEFLEAMRKRIHAADEHAWGYRGVASAAIADVFARLEGDVGSHNSYLPQVSFLNVIGGNRDEVYTLLRNSGYANIAQLFREDERRLPEEDGLTVVRGFLGSYPNYFFQVNEKDLGAFASSVASLDSSEDYDRLLERWGVHRTDPWFWRVSDKLHRMLREEDPVNNGLLDYSRYHAR